MSEDRCRCLDYLSVGVMSILQSFQPKYGAGITESATTSSASYVIDASATTSGGGSKAVVVTNQGATNGVYFKIGVGTQTATDADYYLAPGAQVCVTKAEYDNHIAFLAAASTTAVHAIPGEGF